MEPRAHHVLIGLFTVIAVVAASLFVLWLGKSPSDAQQRYYSVIFNEAVRGLSVGSAVQYSGIRVGDVVGLALDPRDPRKVLARIRVQGNVEIKQDTQARLSFTGITGNSIIELSGGSPDSRKLVAAEGEDPVIVATPSPIAKLLEQSDSTMADITELILRAKNVLSRENVQHFNKTVENIAQVSGAVAGQSENFKVLVKELTAASKQANLALQQASLMMDSADALINKQGVHALNSVEQTAASLAKTTATIDQLLLDNQEALGGGMRGLNELGPALQELRKTLGSMSRIMHRLEDNPVDYLTGREKIQEFEP
jgi:phospholipid/cholesterol/gamma-HCH transport system substrate-binding protein